jgi:hypothetical protein
VRACGVILMVVTSAAPAAAQSVYLNRGDNAVQGTGSWSVGPSSKGGEFEGSFGVDGRVDAGIGIAHYTYTFDDGSKSSFNEYAPFVRFFPVKQTEKAPISLSVGGQLFLDDYGTSDKGSYVKIGTTVYRTVKVTDGFSIQPSLGFAFVAESYTFGTSPAERAQYLTRDLALDLTTAIDKPWVFRFTLEEQAFRRETYRAARVSVIRRLR